MERRNFLKKTLVAGTVSAVAGKSLIGSPLFKTVNQSQKQKFKLNYAPCFGMFKNHAGENLIDQIKFMSDQGFTAMFDNGIMNKPPGQQEEIAKTLDDLGMLMGPFVLYADFSKESFVLDHKEVRDMLTKMMKEGIETAKRTNFKQLLVVPGRYNQRMEWDYQAANVIENLKYCAEILEPAGVVMVIEPLNPHDHPGLFLTKMPQAFNICRAVNSPSCKIVDDLYHQQITEGNLIPNIDRSWSEIAAFHLGDNPGRKEPTTGEINFINIFKHLFEKGYKGVLCMEHGKSKPGKAGEIALIEAYRQVDDF